MPGVTAGVAAPAYAGIPVTHRELASAVAFVTGHEDPAKPESALDWQALAAFPGTLVVYMGVRRLPRDRRAADRGRPRPPTSRPRSCSAERCPTSARSSATLAHDRRGWREQEGIRAPAIAVFGAVAALRERLAGSSAGRWPACTVAVTRARAQASAMARAAARARCRRDRGAGDPDRATRTARRPTSSRYDLVCLTSPNGVDALFERLARAPGATPARFAGARVAAIGPGTARALRRPRHRADVVPERFVAEGLVEALADVPVDRALIARAAEARDVLPDALRERGAEVDVLALYETVVEPLDPDQLDGGRRSRLSHLHLLLDRHELPCRFDGRDEVLADRVDGRGWPASARSPPTRCASTACEPDVEADTHDIDGLIDALVADAGLR